MRIENMIVSDRVLAAGPFGSNTVSELHPDKSKVKPSNAANNGPLLFMMYPFP